MDKAEKTIFFPQEPKEILRTKQCHCYKNHNVEKEKNEGKELTINNLQINFFFSKKRFLSNVSRELYSVHHYTTTQSVFCQNQNETNVRHMF